MAPARTGSWFDKPTTSGSPPLVLSLSRFDLAQSDPEALEGTKDERHRLARRQRFVPALVSLVGSSAIAVLVAQPAQTPSFTAAQAAAGRTAYDRSCSGCHRADLQGSFEAPQLSGSNFLNQWGEKTVADLHAYLMASMPPTDPGSPGADTMINIVAYMLQANGARPGPQPLTPQSAFTVRSTLGARPAAGGAPQPAATPAGGQRGGGGGDAGPAPPPFRKGLAVSGRVKNFVPVTDQMLRKPDPGDWLMFRGNYHGWSYSALKEITSANAGDLELAWVWAMSEGGANQSHPLVHNGVRKFRVPGLNFFQRAGLEPINQVISFYA